DRDCLNGFRCLRTNAQSGCVPSTQSGCDACSLGGTVCTDNECRTSCTFTCASDQFCRGNACYGNDPSHDPRGGTTSTGAGGASGTGTGGQGGTGPSQCGPITEPCSH